MKVHATIDGETHEIEVTPGGEKVLARVGDRNYELEASEPEPNVYLLKHEGRIFEVFVSPGKHPNEPFATRVGTANFEVTLTDLKRLRGSAAAAGDTSGKIEIKTAMPGKVVRILKTAGDPVEKGESVIVVEAMKMQNEMRSPKDGTVKEIRISEGATVSAGDVLVVIE